MNRVNEYDTGGRFAASGGLFAGGPFAGGLLASGLNAPTPLNRALFGLRLLHYRDSLVVVLLFGHVTISCSTVGTLLCRQDMEKINVNLPEKRIRAMGGSHIYGYD